MTTLLPDSIQSPWLIWLGALWLLWLPGFILARLLRLQRSADILLQLALQLGLGLSFWPVFFLWSSTLGWRWSTGGARLALLLLSVAGALLLAQTPWRRLAGQLRRDAGWLALFAFVGLLTAITRMWHIRHLALPPWVDPVSHTFIVRSLLQQGAVTDTFAPLLPATITVYHWGYHAIATWLAWLLNQTEPVAVAQLLLQFGQVLNTLTVLMVYAAGRVLFNSRRAGLMAAAVAGLVSWFPAFYAAWGRYTQLTGLLVLPVFGLLLWRFKNRPTWGGGLALALLYTGLFLIHVRVAFYAVTRAVILSLLLLWQRRWQIVALWALAGAVAVLLSLPRLLLLWAHRPPPPVLSPQQALATAPVALQQVAQTGASAYFPWELLWVPNNALLLSIATGGISGLAGWGNVDAWQRPASGLGLAIILALVGTLLYRRRRRRAAVTLRLWSAVALLAGWVALTALLLAVLPALNQLGGGTAMWGISGVIALFLPISLAAGGVLAWLTGQLTPARWSLPATAALIAVGGIWGALATKDTVSSVTVLATPADVAAMAWITRNTPPDALFAINVRPWFSETYVGTDGGYWLTALTDRQAIIGPTIASPRGVKQLEVLAGWSRTCDMDNPAIRVALRAAGVTHIYIGDKGGHLCPEHLRNRAFVQLLYAKDQVNIFKLLNE